MSTRTWRALPCDHKLRSLCARIADHIPGYTLARQGTSLALRSAPWKTVLVGLTRDGERLVFHGIYPKPKPHPSYWQNGADATITVAATKSPRSIAADITRRLLPKYLDELADVRQRIRNWDQNRATREELITTILKRLPGAWLVEPTPPRAAFVRASRWGNPHLAEINIHPNDDGTAADITIAHAAGPLLCAILNAAADALVIGER